MTQKCKTSESAVLQITLYFFFHKHILYNADFTIVITYHELYDELN